MDSHDVIDLSTSEADLGVVQGEIESEQMCAHIERLVAAERRLLEFWSEVVDLNPVLAGRVAHASRSVHRAIATLEHHASPIRHRP